MATKDNLDDAFKRAKANMNTAFDRTLKRSGLGGDKDVKTYEGLTVEDFGDLSKMYGQDNVLQYIQDVEKKRLIGE